MDVGRESRLRGLMQKEKERERTQETSKEKRKNSDKEKHREQELGSGINEFYLEGISVKWQLLSSVLGKADWQRKICLCTHRLPQDDASVLACVCRT